MKRIIEQLNKNLKISKSSFIHEDNDIQMPKEDYTDEDIKFYNGEMLYGFIDGVELAMKLEDVEAIVKSKPNELADNISEVRMKDYIQEQLSEMTDEQLLVAVNYLDNTTEDDFLNDFDRVDREDFILLLMSEKIEENHKDLF
jgi:hypothetical protein